MHSARDLEGKVVSVPALNDLQWLSMQAWIDATSGYEPDPKLVNETCSGLQGRDAKLLQWISDSGLACLIADNYAVELIATSLSEPLRNCELSSSSNQTHLPLTTHSG